MLMWFSYSDLDLPFFKNIKLQWLGNNRRAGLQWFGNCKTVSTIANSQEGKINSC